MPSCLLQTTACAPLFSTGDNEFTWSKSVLTANEKEAQRQTYRAIVEQIEQGNEEGASVLPVPTDHGVKMRAQSRV